MKPEQSEDSPPAPPADDWFEAFQLARRSDLNAALITAYGYDVGADAAAEAWAYGWEHRSRLAEMSNPLGYLFRVGQSASRRLAKWRRYGPLPEVGVAWQDSVDPDLPRALRRLSERQRVAVVLIHMCGWTYVEAAAAMQVDVSSVRTHCERGLRTLRRLLDLQEDA